MIYFTSDTHFGHHNIIKYCDRPFEDVDHMNEELVKRWNAVVSPDDEVYHLGDFCMGKKSRPKMWLPRLNGTIHLIRGNHDPDVEGFASVRNYHELKWNKKKIVLFHYPIRSWNGMHKGSWHLFGHVHGGMTVKYGRKTLEDCLALDAGSDCFDWTPISIEEVAKIMEKQSERLEVKYKSKVGVGAVGD
jgi:calcineurin-like phosphoesterase family protein